MKNNIIKIIFITSLSLFLFACTKNGEETQPGVGTQEKQLMADIEKRFPFTPNRPFDALYHCGRLNSQLDWYFLFKSDNTLQVLFTTDTYDDYAFDGTYTYQNNVINLQMPAGPQMPFPLGLNESSTVIMPQFGLVAAFATPEMICICQGHNLNTQAPPKAQANYDCPNINIQAVSDEDNAVEFVLRNVPFEFPVPGSIFRQQDTYVQGLTNPLIRRATGIYRQDDNRFYATFRIAADFAAFAGDRLPTPYNRELPFEDYNILTGEFHKNGQEVIVDQLEPAAGACQLR